MRFTTAFLFLTLCTAVSASAQPVQGNQPAAKQAVVFSATGGTSKGSYQGGGDWVVSEFLRRQRADGSFRTRVGLARELELKAVTGASAGNVNALVAAIAWCTQELNRKAVIPAEDSLFWTFWVNTGIDQLMPSDRANREHAVFDRHFFMDTQQNALRKFVNQDITVWPDCTLPVGITMTKQTPAELNLSQGSGVTRVQRFAAVFEADTKTGKLTVESPHRRLTTAGGLGALALPPAAGACPEEEHGLDWAFNVMIASSSFPVAFAPRRVCYEAGGLVTDGVQRAMFADGGVFDNNPAGLALGLADYGSVRTVNVLSPIDVLYTSGSNTRDALREARESAAPQQDLLGLAGTKQLVTGGISSAREYEMQTVMRQGSRDKDLLNVNREVQFFASSRSGEIVGETLVGFGAFLAREFREYDFYSGIYDGLDFMAKYVCRRKELAANDPPGSCNHRPVVTDWIATDLLQLSPEAQLVVRWRQALEQSPGVPMRYDDWADRLDTVKKQILFAIHTQISNLAARRPEIGARLCAARNDVVGNYLCVGGLDSLLYGLKSDPLVKAARKTSSAQLDPAFNELLHAPETRVNSVIETAMNRLLIAEEQLEKIQPEYGAWVETVLLVYRGQSYRYRKGLKWNPSSGRFDLTNAQSIGASVANLVLPNYLTLGVGRSDLYTFGWRPLVWRPRQSVYLGTIGEFTNLEGKRISWRHNTVGATIGSYAPPLPMVSSMEIGVLSSRLEEPERQIFISTSFRFLADKLHLNVRVRPKGENKWYVNLGISDFNGLLYWLIR